MSRNIDLKDLSRLDKLLKEIREIVFDSIVENKMLKKEIKEKELKNKESLPFLSDPQEFDLEGFDYASYRRMGNSLEVYASKKYEIPSLERIPPTSDDVYDYFPFPIEIDFSVMDPNKHRLMSKEEIFDSENGILFQYVHIKVPVLGWASKVQTIEEES